MAPETLLWAQRSVMPALVHVLLELGNIGKPGRAYDDGGNLNKPGSRGFRDS